MEITTRSLWTLIHGMGFGALYLLACSGALVELYRRFIARTDSLASTEGPFLKYYLFLMSLLAWFSVLTGTYVVYPWYRATPPAGTVDLSGYPQKLLLAHAATAGWHAMGMEWKEHVAWLVPITITMAAGVVARYGSDLRHHPRLRSAVFGVVLLSFVSAGIAGFWGAMIDKYAPVSGGTTITLMKGGAPMTKGQVETPRLPNGSGAAALLSAGLGSSVLAVLAVVADHSPAFKKLMIFYPSTGALSGETTLAMAVWLAGWIALDVVWRRRHIKGWVIATGLSLMAIGFLLMFPPVGDLF